MKRILWIAALGAAALSVSCKQRASAPKSEVSDVALLHEAVNDLSSVIVYDIFSPPQASRAYAYASIAAYEAMRPGDTTYHTLAGQLNGLTPVPQPPTGAKISFPLAGTHAFMTVGRQLTFSRARMDSLRVAMDARFQSKLPADVYAQSVAYGDTVAAHVMAWAGKDRFKESRGYPKYSVTQAAGRWVPTPPAYMDAIEPHWGELRPFVMDSGGQFKPEPPFKFDTTKSSPFMKEAIEVMNAQKTMTSDQRAYTAFWDCNPYVMHVQGHTMFATKKITPGGHWMGIVGIAARKANADPLRSAEAYARTAIALADAFISSWDEKYRSAVIRPETVINKYLDEKWAPILQTPPFPEYTSGHSVISNAAAAVLTDDFGDHFVFTDSTEMPYGLPPRTFPSFVEAAAEAAISRLYGGIHYRRSIEQGAIEGKRVGAYVVAKLRTRGTAAVAANGSVVDTSAKAATQLATSHAANAAVSEDAKRR